MPQELTTSEAFFLLVVSLSCRVQIYTKKFLVHKLMDHKVVYRVAG